MRSRATEVLVLVLGSALLIGAASGCYESEPCGLEVCDGRDNDCDSRTDEGFVDAAGDYTQLEHCGSCNVSCAAVVPTAQFLASDLAHVRLSMAMIAVLFAVGVVAGMFWALLRERMYAGFCLYMLMQALYLATVTGEAASLPVFSWLYRIGPASVWVSASVAAAIAIHFLRDFGELRRYAPRASRVPSRHSS